MLFRLAREPIRVLLSVLHPLRLVLASVLQPSTSDACGTVAFAGGDGNGVIGGGLAGDGDREARYPRNLEGMTGLPVTGLDGVDGTLVTVCDEFDRGRLGPPLGIIKEAGRVGRTGADRVLACESSPSDVSLVTTARGVLAVGVVAGELPVELGSVWILCKLALAVERCLVLLEDGGTGNSILDGSIGLREAVGLGSSLDDFASLPMLTLSSVSVAEGLRSFFATSSFLV